MLIRAIATLLTCSSLINNGATPALQSQTQAAPKEIWIGDILTGDDRVRYNGYVLEKRKRKVRYDYPGQAQSSSRIDVSYAVLKRKGKTVAKFDDNIYFGVGNDVRLGLISILGDQSKQMVISQDIPRGGTQWVMNLSPRPRRIQMGRWPRG